jgi:CBS domain containing-hemolysin-like protein
LGRIPRAGEIIEKEGLRLRVETMDGLRVASVSLLNRPTALE